MQFNLYIALSNRLLLTYQNNLLIDHNDYNILISYEDKLLDCSKWDKVISLRTPRFNKASTKLNSLQNVIITTKKYSRVIGELKKVVADNNVNVFYTTLEDTLCNYLFFYFKRGNKFSVVEEGTLNYYLHTAHDLPLLKRLFRKGIAIIMGLNYNPFYKGHTSGVDYKKVVCNYVLEPSLAYNKKKAVKIQMGNEKILKLEPVALIIGQEAYGVLLGKKRFDETFNAFIKQTKRQILSTKSIRKVYYKPHRYGPRIDKEMLRNHFNEVDFLYIESDESLEKVYFNKIKAKYIFTLDSSALLSIYFFSSAKTKEKLSLYSYTVNPKTRSLFRSISKDLNHDC